MNFEKDLDVEKRKLWAECKECASCPRTGRILDEFMPVCKNSCLKKMLQYASYMRAYIPSEFWNLSLKNYKKDSKVLEIVNDYIRRLQKNLDTGKGILFHGGTGTGKSLLANEILKAACRNGFKAKTRSLTEILESLKKSYSDDNIVNVEQELENSDFFCFEDTGLEYRKKDSEFVPREFDRLFQIRKNSRLPTLVTIPYSPEQIEVHYGKHLLSTFYSCMTPVRCKGQDFREEISKKGESDE
jgi:DNA replication protein DnaC